ncbi:TetR/AcrR family transcriptional regulator [Ruegeria sp. R14_0]|uniref:TetR/AcrR family transcriptional regulator n=1 Tax=Ruegeria sp. R14_0 TaxID=2821100 RepID=UPI001ADC33FB|nr:TetR/AcrR family transcriptional regulator [Ruegeria sp. R14_0]
MFLYSAAQVDEFIQKSQLDGVCLALAIDAARDELKRLGDTPHPVLINTSATNLAAPGKGQIEAQAVRMSPEDSPLTSYRVSIVQAGGKPGDTVALMEVTCTFSVDTEPADSTKTTQVEKPERPLSDTAEERRRQIFEGACTVIAKHGFGNASMREIAKASGLSVPLMYKYIKDKDDILHLITTMCMQDIIDFFDTGELFTGPAEQNLEKAVDRYIDYIGENRRYINLVYSETRSMSAENRARVFDMERDFMGRWKGILDKGVEQKVFRPMNTELMANYLYFLCNVWSLRHWSIGKFPESEVRTSLKALIMDGVLAETSAEKRAAKSL